MPEAAPPPLRLRRPALAPAGMMPSLCRAFVNPMPLDAKIQSPDAAPARPALQELSDEALWEHCRRGGKAAWEALVRRYQRLVYTVPRRAGLDEDSCADVFQFSFQRLYENLDKLQDASRLRAWLVTTAKRESLRLLELQRRSVAFETPADEDDAEDPLHRIPDPSPLAEEQLAQWQELHLLRQAVDRLDERTRRFVELVFLQEEPLSYAELAQRLGIPEGSIGPTRARSLAKLRALLAPPTRQASA
jgi:RNA polymerase sigma factor (sigma-70 family)